MGNKAFSSSWVAFIVSVMVGADEDRDKATYQIVSVYTLGPRACDLMPLDLSLLSGARRGHETVSRWRLRPMNLRGTRSRPGTSTGPADNPNWHQVVCESKGAMSQIVPAKSIQV